jgi:hypothetical protein
MRTTVQFSPDLMRLAKARSAELGESLKTLLTRAVAAELAQPAATSNARARVALPLFGRVSGPAVRLSNADLERHLAEADASAAAPRRGPRARIPPMIMPDVNVWVAGAWARRDHPRAKAFLRP